MNHLIKTLNRAAGASLPQPKAKPPPKKSPAEVKASLAYRMRCMRCGFAWRHPDPFPNCPACDHFYVQWTSYAADMKLLGRL